MSHSWMLRASSGHYLGRAVTQNKELRWQHSGFHKILQRLSTMQQTTPGMPWRSCSVRRSKPCGSSRNPSAKTLSIGWCRRECHPRRPSSMTPQPLCQFLTTSILRSTHPMSLPDRPPQLGHPPRTGLMSGLDQHKHHPPTSKPLVRRGSAGSARGAGEVIRMAPAKQSTPSTERPLRLQWTADLRRDKS